MTVYLWEDYSGDFFTSSLKPLRKDFENMTKLIPPILKPKWESMFSFLVKVEKKKNVIDMGFEIL